MSRNLAVADNDKNEYSLLFEVIQNICRTVLYPVVALQSKCDVP